MSPHIGRPPYAPQLPDEAITTLQSLALAEKGLPRRSEQYAEHYARLNCYIAKLRRHSYTLRAIGAAIGLSYERIRQRAAIAYPVDGTPEPPAPPKPPAPEHRATPARHPITTTAENRELRELQTLATQVRRYTPADDPRRAASELFSRRLYEHTNRGVPVPHLAANLGLGVAAVRARLANHGYIKPYPSQRQYQGAQQQGDDQ